MRSFRTAIGCLASVGILAVAAPQLSEAQTTEVVDFSGHITQDTIVYGSNIPLGYQLPGTFTGSLLYTLGDTSSNFISDVEINIGDSQVLGRAGAAQFVGSNSVLYGSSVGCSVTGGFSQMGLCLNGMQMTLAGSTPINPTNINFNSFTSGTLEFDVGGVPSGSDINAEGVITSVKVPETDPLPLLAAGLFAIGLVYRKRLIRALR